MHVSHCKFIYKTQVYAKLCQLIWEMFWVVRRRDQITYLMVMYSKDVKDETCTIGTLKWKGYKKRGWGNGYGMKSSNFAALTVLISFEHIFHMVKLIMWILGGGLVSNSNDHFVKGYTYDKSYPFKLVL